MTLATLTGARVLVTGASGFIGSRLVERLVDCGAEVTILARRIGSAAQLSRFPVAIALGDVLDRTAVAQAAVGQDVVFHCARGVDGDLRHRMSVDVDGTVNVLEVAEQAGVGRVVHVSTFVVYELPPVGRLDETSAYAKDGDAYVTAKRRGEQEVLRRASQLPVAVIQPTVVYGPRSDIYARGVIEELRSSRVPLINGGSGVCNAVFVDDVVSALLLAARSDHAAGERFLVSGPESVTWATFYGAFEDVLGARRTVPMSEQEAIALWRRSSSRGFLAGEALRAVRRDPELRRRLLETREGVLVRRILEGIMPRSFFAPERWPDGRAADAPPDTEAIAPFKPELVHFLASTAEVRTDKARDLLGYTPEFGFGAGMRATLDWARWEGLIPQPADAPADD